MLSLGAIVKVMFGGLGDVKENVTAVRERATRGSGDLLKRAMRSYLLKTKQEVHMARTTLVRQPDDIGKANLDLGIAKIVLDKALALSPDAKVSDKLTKTKSDIDLAIARWVSANPRSRPRILSLRSFNLSCLRSSAVRLVSVCSICSSLSSIALSSGCSGGSHGPGSGSPYSLQ